MPVHRTDPAVGAPSPARMFTSVDLPLPDAPDEGGQLAALNDEVKALKCLRPALRIIACTGPE